MKDNTFNREEKLFRSLEKTVRHCVKNISFCLQNIQVGETQLFSIVSTSIMTAVVFKKSKCDRYIHLYDDTYCIKFGRLQIAGEGSQYKDSGFVLRYLTCAPFPHPNRQIVEHLLT